MSVKRRDNKNRVLRNGESQRKDGRYAYTYVDANGKQKFLYSWKLEKTDKLPQGKRDCVALREKIKHILFNTGLRISEFVGLTESNIDFSGGCIKVDHQVLIRTIDGHSRTIIENPKSENGVRNIPMSDEVAECFKWIIEKRKPSNGIEIDGIKDFLFITRLGNPSHATIWHKRFRNICRKYNKNHEVPVPKITPHICRHTFCSKMARRGMNPKMLQYVMGHSDISMTMNIYAHMTYNDINDIKDEIARICDK